MTSDELWPERPVVNSILDIFDQNSFENIWKIIHVIQKSQIDFDILFETISDQTESKCTWKGRFFTKFKNIEKLFKKNLRFKLSQDTDNRISNWFDFMNNITTELDYNNDSSLTSDAITCTTGSSKKWNPSFRFTLGWYVTFQEFDVWAETHSILHKLTLIFNMKNACMISAQKL